MKITLTLILLLTALIIWLSVRVFTERVETPPLDIAPTYEFPQYEDLENSKA